MTAPAVRDHAGFGKGWRIARQLAQLFPTLLFRINEDLSLHARLHRANHLSGEGFPILSRFRPSLTGSRRSDMESAQPVMQGCRFLPVLRPALQCLPGGSEGFGNPSLLGEHLADLEIRGGDFVADFVEFPPGGEQFHPQMQRLPGLFQHGFHLPLLPMRLRLPPQEKRMAPLPPGRLPGLLRSARGTDGHRILQQAYRLGRVPRPVPQFGSAQGRLLPPFLIADIPGPGGQHRSRHRQCLRDPRPGGRFIRFLEQHPGLREVGIQ